MQRFVAAILVVGASAFAQGRDLSQVEVKVTKVAGNVHLLEGAGGNIGVSAGPDGILIVDDQFAPIAPKIEKAIAPLSPKPLRFLLNTHWHGDHTGSNEYFAVKSVPILAHENVRKRLAKGAHSMGRDVPAAPAAALPVITWEQGISVHFNGEEIRVVHLPSGHTDGDSIVFFTGSKVVHMGDHFFTGFPIIDLDTGGSVKGFLANLERVRAQIGPDMKIIPGHGNVSTLKDVDAYVAMMKETIGRVEKGIKQRKTLDQLKKENVLKGYESWQRLPYMTVDRYLETLYRGLRGK